MKHIRMEGAHGGGSHAHRELERRIRNAPCRCCYPPFLSKTRASRPQGGHALIIIRQGFEMFSIIERCSNAKVVPKVAAEIPILKI